MGQVQVPGDFGVIHTAKTGHLGGRKSALCGAAPPGKFLEVDPKNVQAILTMGIFLQTSLR